MAGRAGRRGLDKLGNVIYYPIREMEPLYCMKNIVINKPETLTSKFLINIKFIMKGIKSEEQEITSILEKSLMNNENNKRKVFLENQIVELIDTKDKNEKQLQLYDKRHIDIVKTYLNIQKTFDSLSGKKKKKNDERI